MCIRDPSALEIQPEVVKCEIRSIICFKILERNKKWAEKLKQDLQIVAKC